MILPFLVRMMISFRNFIYLFILSGKHNMLTHTHISILSTRVWRRKKEVLTTMRNLQYYFNFYLVKWLILILHRSMICRILGSHLLSSWFCYLVQISCWWFCVNDMYIQVFGSLWYLGYSTIYLFCRIIGDFLHKIILI